MLSGKKKGKKGAFAGLALHEDSLRYMELRQDGGGFRVTRQEVIPIQSGGIEKESVKHFDVLERGFSDLKAQIGRFPCPVVLGIPSRDAILRLIDYPKMPVEDIRDALSFEFEKYFPYSWDEAAPDIVEVEVPATQEMEPKSTVLVATCRLSYIRDLVRAADRSDIPIGAIEPMNVAFFRASLGDTARNDAYFIVGIEPDVTNIILGYRDNGILFRSTLVNLKMSGQESEAELMPILQDVQNTMVFAGNQYRGLTIRNLILGGSLGGNAKLKMLLEAGASVNVTVSNVWSSWRVQSDLAGVLGYDTAIGLALRDAS